MFLAYLSKFFKPVQDLAKMTNTIAQTSVALERIQKILAADQIDSRAPRCGRSRNGASGEITFEHVAFGYSDVSHVLRDVNFTIKAGQVVGIVGPTGGGKSTVVSLIPRFYDPTAGRVLIDGERHPDVEARVAATRRSDSCCRRRSSSPGTIRDNIAYGRPDATDADIIAAAKLANADEFIAKMPAGLRLDRRRARRHAFRRPAPADRHRARADPAIADPDPRRADGRARHRVRAPRDRGPRAADEGPHRHHDRAPALSTIRDADQIIVLKDGVVAEQGSHDELMQMNGVYAELYHIQYGTPAAAARRAASGA